MLYFGTKTKIDPVTNLPIKIGKAGVYWCAIDANAVKFGNYPFVNVKKWDSADPSQRYIYDPYLKEIGLPYLGAASIVVVDGFATYDCLMTGDSAAYNDQYITALVYKHADAFLAATEAA